MLLLTERNKKILGKVYGNYTELKKVLKRMDGIHTKLSNRQGKTSLRENSITIYTKTFVTSKHILNRYIMRVEHKLRKEVTLDDKIDNKDVVIVNGLIDEETSRTVFLYFL